jgi:hypothetical protein
LKRTDVKFSSARPIVGAMLNWLARYAPLRDHLLDERGRPRASVLDVGCGPHGLACAFDDVPFVGTDVLYAHRVAPTMVAVRSRPGPLPFADGAFGTVLCLDVLEHVPAEQRPGFVLELGRVAAERLILGCPTSEAQPFDDFLRGQLGEPMPLWLAEHYECGLPTPEEVRDRVRALDAFAVSELPTANGLLAVMLAVADSLPALAGAAADEMARHRDAWIDLLAGATFGSSPRKVWLAERTAPPVPLIAPDCRRDDVAAALRCPECASAHRDLRCTGCGRTVTLDHTGAWDLATPHVAAEPGIDTDARTVLWLAPDWSRSESWLAPLAAYIRASAPEGDTCLVLAAPPTEAVVADVSRACAELAGDRPFGDVLLLTEARDPVARAVPVRDSDDVAAALRAAAVR